MKNIIKHMTGISAIEGRWLRSRHFDAEVLAHIAERIKQGESLHTGELVVAVEAIMPSHETDSQVRALEVYGRLKVWDTPLNSGVLLYLALDQRAIEIIADRGIEANNSQWEQVCTRLKARLAKAEYIDGVMDAVDDIQAILKEHSPKGDNDANALPNTPVIL